MASNFRRWSGWACLFPLGLCVSTMLAADGGRGVPDPVFRRVPFDQWVSGGDQAQIHWTVSVSKPRLSAHQRLEAKVEARVDGKELVKRRGKGGLVMLVQFKDGQDRSYQTHVALDLRDLKDMEGGSEALFSLDALVVPGNYTIAMVVFDTATGEHSVAQRTLHVDALNGDPLPEAWKDLPPVEFAPSVDPPDAWFLPTVSGRLHLAASPRKALHVDLLMNASPPDDGDGPRVGLASNFNLAVLVPAVKALSQIQLGDGSMKVSVLDLMRRKTPFEQTLDAPLDWTRFKAALQEANPNVIDVHSLESREQNAQFFVSEVGKRISAASAAGESDAKDPLRVLIVLSSPMAFHSGADLHAIDMSAPRNSRVFYVRYHSYVPSLPFIMGPDGFGEPRSSPRDRTNRSGGSPLPPRAAAHEPTDSLERTLKPLQPRLFDVWTPEDFRKALGKMLEEISRM